jgi:hypothetical protein
MLLSGLAAAALAASVGPPAEEAFARIASLEGRWEGAYADGSKHAVTYRLTAKGSVIVETWTMSPARESMTLYFLAGGALEAVHYCPQGNQPRLRYDPASSGGALRFQRVGGDNLDVEGGHHQERFWIAIDGPKGFRRSETYVANGSTAAEPDGETVAYVRSP